MHIWLLILMLALSGVELSAQANSSKFVLGAGISSQKSRLEVFTSDWTRLGLTDLESIGLEEKIGARVHADIYYLFGPRSSLRFSPGLFFQLNEIGFVFKDQKDVHVKILPTGLALPIFYQYAPQGLTKGPRFFAGIEMQRLLGPEDDHFISLYNYNLQGLIGVAVPFESRWLKWIPTLSYGMGLESIKKFSNIGMFNNAIDAIQMNTFQLGISFLFLKYDNKKVD